MYFCENTSQTRFLYIVLLAIHTLSTCKHYTRNAIVTIMFLILGDSEQPLMYIAPIGFRLGFEINIRIIHGFYCIPGTPGIKHTFTIYV